MPNDNREQDDPAQSQRFMDMAREVGASEEGAGFGRVFTRLLQEGPQQSKERSAPPKPRLLRQKDQP